MTSRSALAARWEAYVRTPFPLLVGLSINRILHGSKAGDEELNMSAGLLLALLAVPGVFVSIFLFDKYGTFLQWLRRQMHFDPLAAALPDEYFFIVLSMAVTGGVAVWWWDSIFLDRRDFANLVPLPLRTSTIFWANSVAILILTALCALDVNAGSSFLFPLIVGGAQPGSSFVLRFAGAHALAVVLASAFSFLAVYALAGALMLLFPYALFVRISRYVRLLLLVGILATITTSYAVPPLLPGLPQHPYSPIRFLPPVWFVGLCQSLHGRAGLALVQLGHTAVYATVGTAALAIVTYTLSYRRCFVRIPELADTPPGRLGARTLWVFRLLDRHLLRSPVQRAGYRFVIKTLFRNDAHALTLGGLLGLGIVLSSRALFSAISGNGSGALPSPDLLSIPLILGYCLLSGMRLVFDIPAQLQANWIFRLLVENSTHDVMALARRVMLSVLLPSLPLVALPLYARYWGWELALGHVALVAVWCVLLTEVLLAGFRKFPFTCAYPAFRHSAFVGVMAWVFGYVAFAGVTSQLESEALSNSLQGAISLVISLGVWYAIYRLRTNLAEGDGRLTFEGTAGAAFDLLHLSDGS